MSANHAAHLTISLSAVCNNWRALAKMAQGAECGAVVKADAYGCGMQQVAPALAKAGCKTFFVATIAEGATLRALLPDSIIYVFNGLPPGAASEFSKLKLCPVLNSPIEVQEWLSAFGQSPPFALHFDTGINRLGIKPAELAEVPACKPDLILSHFINSEKFESPLIQMQVDAFEAIRARYPSAKACLANSSGIFQKAKPFYDMVRPGYALYGGNPTPNQKNPMQNVVTLHAPVLQVKNVQAGETVGYHATWTAKRQSRLITLPVGYADGYLRSGSASNNETGAQIAWNGALYPVVGRISMDLITADVTDAAKPPQHGNMVELIGPHLPIDAVAARLKTIGYEVLTSLGRRYERKYIT
jgi:alanine racemase